MRSGSEQQKRALARLEAESIANWETPIGIQLGEPIRHGHYGRGVPMNNPTHHRTIYTSGQGKSIPIDINWR